MTRSSTGKEYPIVGDPGHTRVSLKRLDDNTVEEIDHRQGKVVDEIRLAAAKDGKTVQVTDKDMATARRRPTRSRSRSNCRCAPGAPRGFRRAFSRPVSRSVVAVRGKQPGNRCSQRPSGCRA